MELVPGFARIAPDGRKNCSSFWDGFIYSKPGSGLTLEDVNSLTDALMFFIEMTNGRCNVLDDKEFHQHLIVYCCDQIRGVSLTELALRPYGWVLYACFRTVLT